MKEQGMRICKNKLSCNPKSPVAISLSRSITKSLRLVMVEEGGKCYMEKAMEMKEVVGNQELQERHIDNLLNYLKANMPTSRITERRETPRTYYI